MLNGLFGGNLNADVKVAVAFDPLSSLLLALFIMVAIVLSHTLVKVILR